MILHHSNHTFFLLQKSKLAFKEATNPNQKELKDYAREFFRVKGALAIGFSYQNVTMAFVGAHLHPHEENYQQRVANYHQFMNKMKFDSKKGDILDRE